MRAGRALVPVVAVLTLLVFAPSAMADAMTDYNTIRNEWATNGAITPCFYTIEQLNNAQAVSQQQSASDSYTNFPSALHTEIIRTSSGQCPPPGGFGRPVILAPSMLFYFFRASSRTTPLLAALRPRPYGTQYRFTLSKPSVVTFTIQRLFGGRRVGVRCLAPTPALIRARRPLCIRAYFRGAFSRVFFTAGYKRVYFSGHLVGKPPLTPGPYRTVMVARDGAGVASYPRYPRFNIAPP